MARILVVPVNFSVKPHSYDLMLKYRQKYFNAKQSEAKTIQEMFSHEIKVIKRP